VAEDSVSIAEWLRKGLVEHGTDMVREMLALMAQLLMSADVDALCGAAYGSRGDERVNRRNGYRERRWDTRAGTIELAIPKVREGSYFPDWLIEARRRAEKAMISVVADAYLNGISTRKVDKLVRAMGLDGISKSQVSEMASSLDQAVAAFRSRPLEGCFPFLWLDAMAIKCREGGRSINVAAVIAIAVNGEGHREVLGVDVVTTEDGAGWLAFLRSLVSRGLHGVRLVVSDAHPGLKDAIAATVPGAAWQRCRTHFMTNLLTRVPKVAQQAVATLVRSIFAQPDADSVRSQYRMVVAHLEHRFAKAAELLGQAEEELLAFAAFPKAIWRQIWSNNPLERLNKEVRRRTDVVGIFPHRTALLRLVGAVLCEQHDEWTISRRYMSLDVLAVSMTPATPTLQPSEEERLAIPA
jgi:putative transposase